MFYTTFRCKNYNSINVVVGILQKKEIPLIIFSPGVSNINIGQLVGHPGDMTQCINLFVSSQTRFYRTLPFHLE